MISAATGRQAAPGRRALLGWLAGACLSFAAAVALAQDAESPQQRIGAAQKLFQQWLALGDAFDSRIALLYADEATIISVLAKPDGTQEQRSWTGKQFKEVLKLGMEAAKQKNDRSEHDQVEYLVEGAMVRIKSQRRAIGKEAWTPHHLLVAKSPDGYWRIYQEIAVIVR